MRRRGRIHWIDNVRAFAFINMILYHFIFDLVYIFGVEMPWYRGIAGKIWQNAICMTLIFVSGMATHFAREKIRSGLVIFGCGILITVGTIIFMPSQLILFGILHFLGMARLIFVVFEKPLKNMRPAAGVLIFLLLFVVFKNIARGYLGVGPLSISLPVAIYQTDFLFLLGLPGPTFFSGDYFPIIPWIFLYFAGYSFFALLKETGHMGEHLRPIKGLSFIARHTLIIYVIHQPVLYGISLLLWKVGII